MSGFNEKLENKNLVFYDESFDVTDIEGIKNAYNEILEMSIETAEDVIRCLEKKSELSMLIADEIAWRYIKMTCDSDNEEKSKAFSDYFSAIMDATEKIDFEIKKKIYNSEARHDLDSQSYHHLNRMIANEISLFREENIIIKQKLKDLENKYGNLYGAMTVMYNGEEKTLAQLNILLKDTNRDVRQKAWELKNNKLAEKRDEFNKLFDEMKELRIQEAKNAGFDNYRDYMHKSKGRFSYTPEHLFEFHNGVEKAVLPFLKELDEFRKEKLSVDSLRPWDTSVDIDGRILKPFANSEELIDKSIVVLNKVDTEFAQQLAKMRNSEYLDLQNRKGKAPGGYNYPIGRVDSSFIFMNAVGLHDDVTTLLHEAGHAMHAKAISDITIDNFRDTPSEIAELASMSMELITMDYWDEFYANKEDLKKAKKEQLEGTLSFLPWCMIVDAFQHWIYTNPNHTAEERHEYFSSLMDRFNTIVDWNGLKKEKENRWMFQLHIFEVPFYYIEYGMSQLGALAIYKNYKENPETAIKQYKDFLKAGYTVPTDVLYEIAGIKFKFDETYLSELVQFVKNELDILDKM